MAAVSLTLLGLLGTGMWARVYLLHPFRHCESVICPRAQSINFHNSAVRKSCTMEAWERCASFLATKAVHGSAPGKTCVHWS